MCSMIEKSKHNEIEDEFFQGAWMSLVVYIITVAKA